MVPRKLIVTLMLATLVLAGCGLNRQPSSQGTSAGSSPVPVATGLTMVHYGASW